jgi:predicted RNA-binding protein associated with RNAse of E/G family
MSDVQIRFSERPGEVATVLEVDRPVEVAEAEVTDVDRLLFALRLQILSSETFVDAMRTTERFRVCEFDGGPLTPHRKRELSMSLTGHLSTTGEPRAHRLGLRGTGLQ